MQLAPCHQCGGRSFWHLVQPSLTVRYTVFVPSRDVARQLVIAKGLSVPRELEQKQAPLEILICRACCATLWWCAALEGEVELDPGEPRRCDACRKPSGVRSPLWLDGARLQLNLVDDEHALYCDDGFYQIAVCQHCRRVEWFAVGLASLKRRGWQHLPALSGECRSCGPSTFWQHPLLRCRHRQQLEPLRPGREGDFSALVCMICGHAELRAAFSRPPNDGEIWELATPPSSGPLPVKNGRPPMRACGGNLTQTR